MSVPTVLTLCESCQSAYADYDRALLSPREPHMYFKQTGERLCERRTWFEQRAGIRDIAMEFSFALDHEAKFLKDHGKVAEEILRAVACAWQRACVKLFNPPGRKS